MRFFLRIFVVTLVYLSIGVQAARHYSHDQSSNLISAFCELDSGAEEDLGDSNGFISKFVSHAGSIHFDPFYFYVQDSFSTNPRRNPSCHGWYISRYLDFQRFNL
ncbi:MAG: hypothetical protein GC193_03965 [Cryomorphaceae bacterium]|nr:hypothetical protein [Cryomorphaceae bacterium]